MTRTFSALAAAATLSACAACGGLENPDLSRGSLSGRLLGASGNAYVYPLGRPELRAFPGADGRWTIESLPAGPAELVVVDGDPGAWRAELLSGLRVEGGDRTEVPERQSSALPPAGRVAAVARFGGGCESSALRLTVVGTDQLDVTPAAGSAAVLERLPAGTFRLAGRSGGFVEASADIQVQSGATVAYELDLPVSYEESAPGCSAEGAGCRTGLHCDASDGVCHECVEDSHCAPYAPKTRCQNHVCHDPLLGTGETCDPCTLDSQCESTQGGAAAVCATGGFCTHACAGPGDDAACPAGFQCVDEGGRWLCAAPHGCGEAREEFGGECFYDSGCAKDLYGGVCHGEDLSAEDPVPGYCTGRCTRADDCDLVPGFSCNTTTGLCERG